MRSRLSTHDGPVLILGAGISGLTAAHALARSGHDVLVLDRRQTPGGRIHTERRDGFLVEHGPNTVMSPAPGAERLIGQLGLDAERIGRGPAVRHRYLVRGGRVRALPLDPLGFFSSNFFTLRGRLRLLAEPLVRSRAGDESVAAFVTRRFGREMLDYVFDPLIGGLYAGDPEALSVSSLFPQLKKFEREHGSVTRGIIAGRRRGLASALQPARRQLFSLRDGLGTLPSALMQALPGRIRFGVRVEGIEVLADGGFRIRTRDRDAPDSVDARCVIVALPAYAAARVLAGLAPDGAAALAAIAHPPLAVVALGYRRTDIDHPLDGLGMLTPRREARATLGMLFSSTLFEGRAPDGHALLTAYVGGACRPELAQLPREELIAAVRAEATDLLGARGQPLFTSVRYWRHGLPQPDLGHAAHLEALTRVEREFPGLLFTGNYVAGVSTAACIDRALAVAQHAADLIAAASSGARRCVANGT